MLTVQGNVEGRTHYGRMRGKRDCEVGSPITALEEQFHLYLSQLGELLPKILPAKYWSSHPVLLFLQAWTVASVLPLSLLRTRFQATLGLVAATTSISTWRWVPAAIRPRTRRGESSLRVRCLRSRRLLF